MWEPVDIGRSGATVTRRPGAFRKQSRDPAEDLVSEGARLTWLRAQGLPAPVVLECEPGLLITAAVPGRTAAEAWPRDALGHVVAALARVTRRLHALPIAECPFDRRLATVIPIAEAADPDLDDLDAERRGWTREQLVQALRMARPPHEDLVVCHGDLCLPNVVLNPETFEVTGLIDAGRLGVADRWADLALTTRSLTSIQNPQYPPWAETDFLRSYGADPDPQKLAFYRLLDEFF